jgi:hypothetical protein
MLQINKIKDQLSDSVLPLFKVSFIYLLFLIETVRFNTLIVYAHYNMNKREKKMYMGD